MIGRGYNVGMCDVNSEAGNTLSAELGEQVVFIKCDVAIYEDQAEAFQQVWNRWGRLDFGTFLSIRKALDSLPELVCSRCKCRNRVIL